MTNEEYKTITADMVVNILAAADEPLGSRAVMHSLGTQNRGKVVSMLTDLVRQETLEQVKGKYRLRDPGRYDTTPDPGQGTRRTLLPTDKQAIAAGERHKAAEKAKKRQADTAKMAVSAKDSAAEAENVPPWLPSPPVDEMTPDSDSGKGSGLPNGTIPVDKSELQTDQSVDKANPVKSKSVIKRLVVQQAKPVTTLEEIEAKVEAKSAKERKQRILQEFWNFKSPSGVVEVSEVDPELQRLKAVEPHTIFDEADYIEAKVDENNARDQRIRDAVQRLKIKANFRVEPVDRLQFKIEILHDIASSDPDLWEVLKDVITDLRRLDELSVGPF